METEFIGKGFKFPFEIVGSGGLAKQGSTSFSDGMERIKQSIAQILGTAKGERFMDREFGSRLFELIFEPNDNILKAVAERFIRESLGRYEKRIELKNVLLEIDRDLNALFISITFKVLRTNVIGNMVYPFFLAVSG